MNILTEILTTLKNVAAVEFDWIFLEDAQDQLLKAGELANSIIKLPYIVDLNQLEELKRENKAQQKLVFEQSEKINQQ